MKKQFTFLLLFSIALTARAHYDDGVISITNLSRQNISIEVDGRKYTNCNSGITIGDVAAGYHMVKIYGEKRVGKFIRRVIIYNRNTYVKPKYYIDIIINRFGRALTDEQLISNSWYNENENPGRPGNEDRIPVPINDETFSALKETVSGENFDDSRMAIAKSSIDQHYFTANQAKQLAQLFSFEGNKLEIAKCMYAKTIDRKNYFVVYSVFTFSKTKQELAEYIRNFK